MLQAYAQSQNENVQTIAETPLIMSINVYVKPESHEKYIEWYSAQQSKHKLDGVVFSYLEAPTAKVENAPFKSVTIWRSRSAYDDYMKNIKAGRPAAALSEKRSASDMLSAPPQYLITVPVAFSR